VRKNARVLKQTPPVYPYAMRVERIEGKVLIDFIVNIEGHVTNAYVLSSTAPWFEGPALDAVRTWDFDPGYVDGVPVNTHLEVPILFSLNGGGGPAFGVSGHTDKGTFNAEVASVIRPAYPYSALASHQDGTATVRMLVTPSGQVAKVQVMKASAPEFGMSLAAACSGFTFIPAFKDGKPIPSLIDYEEAFRLSESVDNPTWYALDALQKGSKHLVAVHDLDHPLAPLSRRPPVSPPSLGQDETVLIEFLVDTDGTARLAHVKQGAEDLCAYAAMQAVDQWLFEPPTHNGKPVMTIALIPFAFKMAVPVKAAP
jgi:TonB family protein